jgi:hypothetical protein
MKSASGPGRFDRWLGSGHHDRDAPQRWFSPAAAFLWLAIATTLVAVAVVLTAY